MGDGSALFNLAQRIDFDVSSLRYRDGQWLVGAVLTDLEKLELEEGAGSGMLHSQGTFNAASTTWTFPADHCLTLARVSLPGHDICEAIPQNISNRIQRLTTCQHIAIG